ncbi:MAG: phosphate ABC transporter substrate-binding protein [Verrucomicrobia bacterium]|nr:MAG: phosphate ABC transporter substrate-binding protein [Verrucomicrobiota bacterium]
MQTRKQFLIAGLMALTLATAHAAGDPMKIVVDGSTTVGPIAKAFAEYYMKAHPDVNITVSESGSGNGAKGIINGACDVGTMSRAMKNEELDAAKAKGRNPVQHTVAFDGIAVVVHPGNPVKNLAKDQLRDIFTGEIKNWKKVGGPDLKIVVISRDTNSGTYETFQEKVTKSERVTDRAEYVGSNGAVRQRVQSTPGAIGYVGLAFTEGVKAVTINGIEATTENVIAKKYPISRGLYMYTNGEPAAGTPLADYVGLYKTEEGKKLIGEQGYVPVK